jgi:hypothetical protein
MKMVRNLAVAFIICIQCNSYAQKSSTVQFGGVMMADSASTIMIPILYDAKLFSDKMAWGGNYYANLLFYNFKTDKSKKLFAKNTYITSLVEYHYGERVKTNTITKDYIFYRVQSVDHNKNGKIDPRDPSILYVSDKQGNNLKVLTAENENVVGLEIFDKQRFMLVKMQRDLNQNRHFDPEDEDFYYVKLDLDSLTFGTKIELD